MRRTTFLIAALILLLGVGQPGIAAGDPTTTSDSDARTMRQYAVATWASLVAMTDSHSGLPADSLGDDGVRSVQTSTTNIGAYLWSAVAAYRLGIIDRPELLSRLGTTLNTLEHLERDSGSGQFYNWYDATTAAVLTSWPPTGAALTPILSSVDNAWLATGLRVVRGAVPQLADRAETLYRSMDFGVYYRPDVNRIAFHIVPSTGESPCCYDTVVSESRMASYLGIANGQLPQKEYFGTYRAFPADCGWSWQETKPAGPTRTYWGQSVFDGSYPYAGVRITPSWGGSAFEDLMPALFVPEETWGARSWGSNHPNTVRAQIYHGLVEAQYGYWGFSPSQNPDGGYSVYGVDAAGSNPDGYPSNNDNTLVDHGFSGCPGRAGTPDPPASAYTNGVVTPHASFLALRWDTRAALTNLARLRSHFEIYSRWGFRDAVNVQTGQVTPTYLSLDQGMIMAALGNALGHDVLRQAFWAPDLERRLRPVLSVETFNSAASK
ncbi:MAG TPA: glucoamylase family protein [Kineosporiaceae bacterium]|nr:glucoamylase family protein [Kineosporiaceae bacterium]